MTLTALLHTIPEELRRTYRKYENCCKKLINNTWSARFNEICLKEEILPNYSRLKLHDPAVAETNETLKYRTYLVEKELEEKRQQKCKLTQNRDNVKQFIDNFACNSSLKTPIEEALKDLLCNYENIVKVRTVKKLNTLYHGGFTTNMDKSICIKHNVKSFINLSDYQLSEPEIEFLNLGLNCHIQPKYDPLLKQTELEVMYQSLLKLEEKEVITINPNLADQLKNEGTKKRYKRHNTILTPPLKKAAENLKNNENITIRKADKSSVYVILNKDEYISKVDTILADTTKFKCIQKDPSNELKQKINKVIERLNAVNGDIKLNKIIGDYQPGYIYGNVKTHKPGNPIRPIISQIPTPTYDLAKTINKIITPYIPCEYLLRSTNDFIDLLQSSTHKGIIASLDVESLFTNVPIDATIDIIIKNVYNHPDTPPPKIPKEILKNLLQLCTKEAPFRCPRNKLYLQIEGVAMGSPLGPTFANFYMGELESKIFKDKSVKPPVYARYVDDIFLQVKDESQLIELRKTFQDNSVLNFTYELSVNNKLPFLDVLVEPTNGKFRTSVYHKKTDSGNCLNGNSECIDRYKSSVITNYLNRAYKVSDSWNSLHNEIKHVKQVLVNNNYSNKSVDQHIKKFLENKLKESETKDKSQIVPIYFQNQTHLNSKLDERIIKDIVNNNVKCIDENKKLRIIFYYKNLKTHSLVMKNNLAPKPPVLQQSNVVYRFACPFPHSKAEEYIGFTQTTLSRRLTMHAQNGSILKHFKSAHNQHPTREQLVENTTIIARANDRYKLAIKEALLILRHSPSLNIQFENFTNILKLYSHCNSNRTLQAPTHGRKYQKFPHVSKNSTEPPNTNTTRVENESSVKQNSSNYENLDTERNDTHETDIGEQSNEQLPDFEAVLIRFGVDPHGFSEVTLEEFHRKIFPEEMIDEDNTISQRIRSLVRRARPTNKPVN